MCLLTYFDHGIMPDCDALLNGAISNDDGHGFAIVDLVHGRIITERGMKAEVMIDRFEKIRKHFPAGPAIFHSRFTTDGMTGKYNTHPFEVEGYADTVLAHNGIFPSEARPKVGDIRSDTRIVAESVAPVFPLHTRKGRRKFGKWMGSGNKVVILTLDPRFTENSYIINEHLGTWEADSGIWYSNSGYMPVIRTLGYKKGWEEEWDEYRGSRSYEYRDGAYRPLPYTAKSSGKTAPAWDDCPQCLSPSAIQPSSGKCHLCKACGDCRQDELSCQCWEAEQTAVVDEHWIQRALDAQDEEDAKEAERVRAVNQVLADLEATGWPKAPEVSKAIMLANKVAASEQAD